MRFLLAISIFCFLQEAVFAQPDIKSGEYFIGTIDPGTGTGIPFTIIDGLWDEVIESIVASAQTITSSNTPTLINIRLKDNANNWGPLFKKTIFTGTSQLTTRTVTITSAEYFLGAIDPGEGQGTPLLAFDGAFDEAVETILKTNATWPVGSQTTLFNIRFKDTDNKWGPLFKKVIFTAPTSPANRSININYAEYFFGVIDPGEGQGTLLLAFDGAFDEAVETILKSNATPPGGNQTTLFNIRVKDTDNKWGPLFKKVIFTDPSSPTNRSINISYAEYFFGVIDPGVGQGTPLLAFDGAFDEAVESIVKNNPTWPVGNQTTLFNIRVKDTDNNWGPLFKKVIFTDPSLPTNRSIHISYAEYYFGIFDPGEGQGTPILTFDGAFDNAVENLLRTNATWTVTNQPTLFNLRVKDTDNNWGPVFKKVIFPYGANPTAELIAEGDSLKVCPNSLVTLTYNGPNGYIPTWFNGTVGDSVTFTIASAGYYLVSATLGNSSYSDSIYIDFVAAPEPVISPSGSILTCGSSVITLTTSVFSNTSYQWYFNNNVINGATNANYLPTQIGSYFVKTTTISDGCVRLSNTVNLFTSAVISPLGSVTSCATPIQLKAPSGTGNTYQWRLNGVNIAGANSQNLTASASGNYSVAMTNGACSSISPTTNVTITTTPAIPIVTASGSTTFCVGGSVVLTSSSATGNSWSNGATTQSITVSNSGSYSVTVSNGNCTASSAPTVVIVSPLPTIPTITASGSTTFCAGGSVVLTSSSATGNIWSNGATTQSITVSQSGSYSVTVSNENCTATSTPTIVTVNPIPTPTITANGSTTFCAGGSVVLTSSSAIGNTWSNGATTPSITVSNSGSYSVTVSNGNCTASSTPTVVTVNPIPTPTITSSGGTTFCAGGAVVLTSSSSTGNTWSNGATTQSITVSQSGSYTVNVSNGNCSASSAATVVTVNSLPATPTITAGGSTTFCAGGSVVLTSSSPTGNTWSNGATTQSITVSQSGSYSVTVSNGNCSASSAATVVTVNSLPATPTITAGGSTTFCAGGSVVLTSSSATGNTWSNGATTQAITVSQSGSYSVTVSNGNCTANSAPTVVTVNPLPTTPTVTAGSATTFCAGGSVVLTSASPTGNTWSNGASTQSITVSQSGSYSVTVSNGNCQANSAPTVVTVNPLPATPTITAGGSTTFCAGGSVVLTSSNTTGNTWINGSTTPAITVSQSGSYSVTVSNGYCTANSAPTVVTVNPLPATPTITAGGPTTFCAGSSVVLTSSSTTGNTWSNGTSTQSITVSQSGSYSVTVSNGNCQASSAPAVITVNPLPALYGGPDVTVCAGQSVTLTAIGSTPPFIWSGGIQNGVPFTPTTTNTYTVSIINSNGCINSDQVLVTVNPLPAVNAGVDVSVCAGIPITLSATGASTYSWNNGIVNGVPFTPNVTNTYTVTGTDANGCNNTDQVVVTVNPLPNINAGIDLSVCAGTPVTLTATGASTYAWNNGVVNGVSFTPLATTSYVVIGTDANGCKNSDSTTVTVLPLGVVSLPSNIEYCIGSGHLSLPQGQGNLIYSGVAVYNNGTTFYTEVPALYTINYLFTNVNGCTQTGSITITAHPRPLKPTIQQVSSTKLKTNQNAANYQWYRNDIPINGANSNELSLTTGGKYSIVVYNNFGCGTMSEGFVIGPNGLSTEEIALRLVSFPNPTVSTTTFELIGQHSEKIMVVVYSVLGELIAQEAVETPTGAFTMDFSPYPAGTYNVKILDLEGNFQFDERIVKMN